MDKTHPGKRPIGVWIITVYIAVTIPFTLLSLYFFLSNQLPLDQDQARYMASMTPLDYMATAIISLTGLLGAVSLFRLRKIALHFFIASLVLNIALTIWHIAAKGYAAAMGSLVPTILGLSLVVAIVAYTAHLSKKQVLQ